MLDFLRCCRLAFDRVGRAAPIGRKDKPLRLCRFWAVVVAVLLNHSLLGAVSSAVAEELGELPYWPIGLGVPEDAPPPKKQLKNAAILAWVPPDVERIRAVLLIRQNTDSKHFGEHAPLRRVATKHEMAIVYLRYYPQQRLAENRRDRTIFQILDAVADATEIDEFRHAPWITFGKSSMGKFPFYLAWAYPNRSIATISYHAETPTWPPEPWASVRGESILHVSLNGETEWGGTWNRHVRPSLLNYRAKSSWLPHQAVAHDVGHGNYLDVNGGPGWGKEFPDRVTCVRVWDYLSLFVDKALALRMPRAGYPTRGPLELRRVDPSTGILIRPHAIEDLFKLPRIPLTRSGDSYVIDPPGQELPATFVAVAPAAAYKPPAGVPVEPLRVGQSPSRWLLTEGLNFAMRDDPMRSVGDLVKLRPKPGDRVTIDKHQATFVPIKPRFARREGGIALNNGLQAHDKATLLAYTVLDVPKRKQVKLNAPFTQNGRVQVVLAGQCIAHGQVVEMEQGLYPMLVVVRLRTKWSTLRAGFEAASAKEVRLAREATAATNSKSEQDDAAARPDVPRDAPVLADYAEVPEDDRENWLWVADTELAEAWFRLHAVHGQKMNWKN